MIKNTTMKTAERNIKGKNRSLKNIIICLTYSQPCWVVFQSNRMQYEYHYFSKAWKTYCRNVVVMCWTVEKLIWALILIVVAIGP